MQMIEVRVDDINAHLFQVILIDDLADTCFTLHNAVTQLVRVGGARSVFICVTHAVLSQMPQELFCRPELVKMVVTNTVNQDYSDCHESITEKLVVIDVSDVIGEAIRLAPSIGFSLPDNILKD